MEYISSLITASIKRQSATYSSLLRIHFSRISAEIPNLSKGKSALTLFTFTGKLSSIACKSSSIPLPSFAEILTPVPICGTVTPPETRSHLFSTGIIGVSLQPKLQEVLLLPLGAKMLLHC